eukprot:2734371-Amphidinium_carterae.1
MCENAFANLLVSVKAITRERNASPPGSASTDVLHSLVVVVAIISNMQDSTRRVVRRAVANGESRCNNMYVSIQDMTSRPECKLTAPFMATAKSSSFCPWCDWRVPQAKKMLWDVIKPVTDRKP